MRVGNLDSYREHKPITNPKQRFKRLDFNFHKESVLVKKLGYKSLSYGSSILPFFPFFFLISCHTLGEGSMVTNGKS